MPSDMTPQDCLTCPVADLMPVCARIVPGEWRVCVAGPQAYLQEVRRGVGAANMNRFIWPCDDLNDAAILQAEIARRGLRGEFAEQLMDIVNSTGDAMDLSTAAEWWRLATATAEQRCRACCAALLEHEQRKGTA